MYILIASPDKISINAFLRHLINSFKGLPIENNIGLLNSYMNDDQIKNLLLEFTQKSPEGLLTYFAKGLINKDPMLYLPKRLIEIVDAIIWFDLYSTEPKILKSSKSQTDSITVIIQNWNDYIKKIS